MRISSSSSNQYGDPMHRIAAVALRIPGARDMRLHHAAEFVARVQIS